MGPPPVAHVHGGSAWREYISAAGRRRSPAVGPDGRGASGEAARRGPSGPARRPPPRPWPPRRRSPRRRRPARRRPGAGRGRWRCATVRSRIPGAERNRRAGAGRAWERPGYGGLAVLRGLRGEPARVARLGLAAGPSAPAPLLAAPVAPLGGGAGGAFGCGAGGPFGRGALPPALAAARWALWLLLRRRPWLPGRAARFPSREAIRRSVVRWGRVRGRLESTPSSTASALPRPLLSGLGTRTSSGVGTWT